MIIGGGQTGLEIFRNALKGKWGDPKSLNLVSRRHNLEPLDESAFANDYFTPDYVDQFWHLDQPRKDELVAQQKLTSDGNTPYYLQELYNDLYIKRFVEKDPREINILPLRFLNGMEKGSGAYNLNIRNHFKAENETLEADVVILATGFKEGLPPVLEPLFSRLNLDKQKRFVFNKNYSLKWDGPSENKIYALNFSRHNHGIVDPQTSLMAWRSGQVVNDVMGRNVYQTESQAPCFLNYTGTQRNKR